MHLCVAWRGNGVDMSLAATAGDIAVRVIDHPLRKIRSKLGLGHLKSPSEPSVKSELTAEPLRPPARPWGPLIDLRAHAPPPPPSLCVSFSDASEIVK